MMRIGFLLGSPDISGGTYVIYEYGSRLRTIGHRVAMITREKVTPNRYAWHPGAAGLEWYTLENSETEKFDIILATWWQSPFLLHKIKAQHYVYFVQSIETRFFEETDYSNLDRRDNDIWRELCECTYGYNLPMITEASWIQKYLFEKYNQHAWLVRNGIRKDIYRTDGQAIAHRVSGKLRVLVEGPVDVFYKNVPLAVSLAQKAGADEIWLLTSSAIETFPAVDKVFSRLPINETPNVYRSCDVLLKLSYVEGMFGPPLEMFHCGGTAVVFDVTGADEYMEDGRNSFIVKRDDNEAVISCLQRLRQDPDLLMRLKQGAIATAAVWPGWESAATQFAEALFKITGGSSSSRKYFEDHTKKLFDNVHGRLAARESECFVAREIGARHNVSQKFCDNNFVQIYWKHEEHFDQLRSQWQVFQPGFWQIVNFEIILTGLPFWLRIDPSVRIGVLEIGHIQVRNKNGGTNLLDLSTPANIDRVYMHGTVTRLKDEEAAVFLSCGCDPQLIIPAIEEGQVGDILQVEISLRETGIGRYVNDLQRCNSNKLISSTDTNSNWLSFLEKILKYIKKYHN